MMSQLKKSTHYGSWQFRIFLLCWIAYALIYFGRVNISIAMLDLQKYFSSDKATIGMLGSVFFWTYAVGQLINGAISDKVSSRLYIFIGLVITGASNIAFSISNTLGFSLIIWALNGLGQSMLWSSIVKTAGQWFEPKQYTRVMVGLNTSMVLGYLMAWGGCGIILKHSIWNNVFLIPGIILVGFSFVWLVFARNKPMDVGINIDNTKLGDATQVNGSPKFTYRKLFFATGFLFIVAACITQGMIKEGIGMWAPSMLSEMYKVDISSTTSYVLFIPLMNLAGILATGWLNKKFAGRDQLTTISLLGFAFCILITLSIFAFLSFGISVFLIGVCSAAIFGVNTMLLGVLPIRFSKFGKAAFVTGCLDFSSYLGAGISMTVIGKLLDGNWGGRSVFIVWALIAFVGIALLMANLKITNKASKNPA